jgi:hypothetical protein
MMKRIVITVLSLICIGLMSCGGSAAPAPPTTSATPPIVPAATDAPTIAPTQTPIQPPAGDPFEFIKSATLAQLQATSFRATTNLESGDGTKSQLIIEYVAPDRIHVNLGGGNEQIAIKGKGAWIKENDTWEASPPGSEAILFSALSPESAEQTLANTKIDTVRFVGVELLNAMPMFVYTYESEIDMGTGATIQGMNKVWIGVVDRRVHQVEATTNSIVKEGAQDRVIATYEYDIPITIEAPI